MKKKHLAFSRFMLWCVFSTLYATVANAQSNIDMPKVVPASPTAAALGMYGNIPISLYTGLPNISIPIWNLKGREISLPITLSYRAGGVKVEDMASWVGLVIGCRWCNYKGSEGTS